MKKLHTQKKYLEKYLGNEMCSVNLNLVWCGSHPKYLIHKFHFLDSFQNTFFWVRNIVSTNNHLIKFIRYKSHPVRVWYFWIFINNYICSRTPKNIALKNHFKLEYYIDKTIIVKQTSSINPIETKIKTLHWIVMYITNL